MRLTRLLVNWSDQLNFFPWYRLICGLWAMGAFWVAGPVLAGERLEGPADPCSWALGRRRRAPFVTGVVCEHLVDWWLQQAGLGALAAVRRRLLLVVRLV